MKSLTLRRVVIPGSVKEGVKELQEGVGGDDVAVDEIGEEAKDVARRLPHARFHGLLQLAGHHVHKLYRAVR